MKKSGFPFWPYYAPEEIEVAARVLASGRVNYWTGDEGHRFEREFASFHGLEHAVAVANGTVALELALRALDIGKGDEVVVTPRTFIASVSSVVNVGARPVFAEVDRDSGNLTPDSAGRVLTSRTRAIMAVHLAGWPCDMEGLTALAEEHGLFLIEDCAQALGAAWAGRPVGCFGQAAAFSFCTDKIISTAGEGGMVLFRDEKFWRRGWSYKDHGKDWDAVYHREHRSGFKWLHETLGTNWRLTEVQSAIGRVQLKKLPQWLEKRRANAGMLIRELARIPGLRVPAPPPAALHAFYKLYAYVCPERLRSGWDRDRIVGEVVEQGVPCQQGICPEVYLEKAFDDTGLRPSCPLPVARELGQTSLMFTVHPTLGEKEMAETVRVVSGVMRQAVG